MAKKKPNRITIEFTEQNKKAIIDRLEILGFCDNEALLAKIKSLVEFVGEKEYREQAISHAQMTELLYDLGFDIKTPAHLRFYLQSLYELKLIRIKRAYGKGHCQTYCICADNLNVSFADDENLIENVFKELLPVE